MHDPRLTCSGVSMGIAPGIDRVAGSQPQLCPRARRRAGT